MASYRSYGDTGAYRSRTGIASSTFGRTAAAGTNLPSCRTSYSTIGSTSSRLPTKDRVSTYGNAFLKKDKTDEKPSFKYSATKESDKSRLHPGRSSSEDVRAKSPLSNSRSSLFEKYSYPAAKTSDRPASVLDRYNRTTSREKSREPDGVSRYGSSTYPGSGLARNYGNECRIEKKERADHPPVSYRGLRPNSGRSSREPSPEVSVGKTNSFRMYSRASSYGRSGANSSASESSSAPISSRFGSTASSRFLSSRSSNDRVPSAISYSGSDRFRTSGSKPMSASSKNEDSAKTSSEKDSSQEPFAKPEGHEADSRLQDNDTLTLTMVTRGTSPSPPASSSYVRSRRADVGIAHQKEVVRARRRPETKDQEVQCDRAEDSSRFSRFGGGGRISESPWSSYLDKFSSSNSGGSGVYGRSYNSSGSTANTRVNSFAFSRPNDNGVASRNESASKVSPTSSQEIHASRNQNEQSPKVFGSIGFPRAGQDSSSSVKADPLKTPTSPGQGNSGKDQTNSKLQTGDSRAAAKAEPRNDRFSNSKTFNNDSMVSAKREGTQKQSAIVAKSPDARESISRGEDAQSSRESSVSKSEGNQRRPSIPRLGRGSTKNETKIMKASSGSSTKSEGLRERRGSTPKSDTSTFSRSDESSRIVEGYCQEQSEDIASSKRDNASAGKESLQSATPVSRSSTSQSRSGSSRNLPRQMTRTDSSDGSAVNVPIGRSKSSSASSMTSQGSKIKATPSPLPGKSSGGSAASSVNLRQGGSPDARGKPPVPKTDVTASTASKCLVPVKYVNKDFRKSTLNMENGDPSQSKLSRKKKSQRSMSVSSQDSQSEPNSEPLHQTVPSESSSSLKTSTSRLRMPSSGSKTSTSKSGSSSSLRPEKPRSGSRSPSARREKEDGSSSSSSNSESNSSNSSSSEDDDEKQTRPGSRRRRRRTSKSPFCEKRGKISAGSSRTSVVASSADEMSLTIDKPPRPPSSPRSKSDRSGKTEEAKSFLMRALAPVTNLFKNKQQDSGESGKSGGWLDSNEENSDVRKPEHNAASLPKSLSKSGSFTGSEKGDDRRHSRQKIRRDYSGEQPWWMDPNSDNVPEGVETRSVCNDDISQETTVSGTLPDDGKFKYRVWRQDSEERAWWLDSNDSVASEDTRKHSSATSRLESGEKGWWLDSNDSTRSDETQKQCSSMVSRHDSGDRARWLDGNDSVPSEEPRRSSSSKVWRQESGERAWWLDANDNVSSEEPKKKSSSTSSVSRRGSTRCSTRSSERRNRIRHQQSGERAWWMSDDPENVPEGIEVIPVTTTSVSPRVSSQADEVDTSQPYGRSINKIRHIESGEKAWWMDSSSNVPEGVVKIPVETSNSTSDSSESFERIDIGAHPEPETYTKRSLSRFPIEFPPPPPDEPLGDRASPEGVENPPDPPDNYGGRDSPYDNVQPTPRRSSPRKRPSTLPLFIGEHTNIDDLLGDTGTLCPSPVLSLIRKRERERIEEDSSGESSECEEIDATQVIIHDSTPQTPVIQRRHRDNERPQPDGYIPLDDTALQLYKDGDYGAYLDLEASISEQQEEFEGFQSNRKNSIVLRTQLSVRVHTIIEKLLNSEGRELRRALFSLKQIFQEDKDLVHEFVQNDGLACLIKVGSEADQNYQNYILRALGQVMLYVDGMNGVMEHGQTVQWLYTLIASRFRLVVKTALKLLLVFVEYVETNSLLLVRAVRSVDTSRGMIPWTNVMKLLKDYDAADTELLIYATTLVNKCLNGIPDQDTYYDQVDCLEEQGIEGIIQRYMSKQGTDLDLLRQFQIYEAVLHHEDGNDRGSPIRQLDDNIRKTLRNRKSLVDSHERRKSRRHSTGTSPLSMSLNARLSPRLNHSLGLNSLNNTLNSSLPDDDDESSSSQSSQGHLGEVQLNGSYKENKVDVGVTPALRRRRERAERQRSFIREQQEATATMRASVGHSDDQESPFPTNGLRYTNGTSYDRNADSPSNKLSRTNSRKDLTPLMNAANKLDSEEKKPWYGKSPDEGVECDEGNHTDEDEDRRVVLQLKREGTVKDLTQKLAAQNLIPSSPVEEKVSRIGDMSGLISKAKEGLAKSKSKADVLKSPTSDNLPKLQETKKSENELHWEELVKKLKRPLALCDLDFTDLNTDDEVDVLGPVNVTNGVPPPPPPMVPQTGGSRAPPPPPLGARLPPPLPQAPPPLFGVNFKSPRSLAANETSNTPKSPPPTFTKKSKKTVKLFWKEVRDDPIILSRLDKNKMVWDELSPVPVDTQKLEHLFESRAKDLITK
ncbi:formin homology 2 domain containing isoform X5 [Halictus rubicundus]